MVIRNKIWFSAILVVISCLGFQAAFGQNITFKGALYERDSFSKIPFAVVSIKGKMQATTTDESGAFDLQCNLSDTLIVSHVGYSRVKFPIRRLYDSSGRRVKVYIDRKTVDLVAVTVSGKRLTKEKKEEYERHLNRTRPTISSPISMIYESLSRKGKERTKMDAIYEELILRDLLETRLPPKKLYLITNDRSVKLDDLLLLCPVSSEFATSASDYAFFIHFSNCWKAYQRLH